MKVTHMRVVHESGNRDAAIIVVREDGAMFQAVARGRMDWWDWTRLPLVPGTEAHAKALEEESK